MPTSILSQFTMTDLEDLITENSSLRGYMQGYLAELALKKQLLKMDGVTSVEKIPDQNPEKGDLRVTYKGEVVTVEVKSLDTSSVRQDILNDTWQGRVLIKNSDKRVINVEGVGELNTTCLVKGEFDILAICCYAVSKEWDFLFMENRFIPEKSEAYPGVLKSSFSVNPDTTALVTANFKKVLDSVLSNRIKPINV